MSRRIKYREGSSLPYFDGDKSTMTADEAMVFVNRWDYRKVVEATKPALVEFARNELFFRSNEIGIVIAGIARSIMGQDRPLHEDDREYYALCDRIFQRLITAVETALDDVAK
jgi:hypothetical protein